MGRSSGPDVTLSGGRHGARHGEPAAGQAAGRKPSDRRSDTTSLRLVVPDVYGCRTVSVAGDMTAWVEIDMPFDGQRFAIDLVVPRHGRWRYRYCLDESAWINDPEADDFEACGDEGAVSVRYS